MRSLLYDASIRYTDDVLERFGGILRVKERDRMTVFLTADHGEGMESMVYLHAHQFWEEVIRVPLWSGDLASSRAKIPGLRNPSISRRPFSRWPMQRPSLPDAALDPAWTDGVVISEYNEFGIRRQAIIGERYVIWQRPADTAAFKAVRRPEFSIGLAG